MDGTFREGFYLHPTLGIIRIFENKEKSTWVYQCYSENGTKPLSRERDLDQWTWALSQPKK